MAFDEACGVRKLGGSQEILGGLSDQGVHWSGVKEGRQSQGGRYPCKGSSKKDSARLSGQPGAKVSS